MEFCVVCNVYGDPVLRDGALCVCLFDSHGVPPSIYVKGISKGGRSVRKWTRLIRCVNFRARMACGRFREGLGYKDKESAQYQANILNNRKV